MTGIQMLIQQGIYYTKFLSSYYTNENAYSMVSFSPFSCLGNDKSKIVYILDVIDLNVSIIQLHKYYHTN